MFSDQLNKAESTTKEVKTQILALRGEYPPPCYTAAHWSAHSHPPIYSQICISMVCCNTASSPLLRLGDRIVLHSASSIDIDGLVQTGHESRALFITKFPSLWIPIIKIRWSCNHLFCMLRIPILVNIEIWKMADIFNCIFFKRNNCIPS